MSVPDSVLQAAYARAGQYTAEAAQLAQTGRLNAGRYFQRAKGHMLGLADQAQRNAAVFANSALRATHTNVLSRFRQISGRISALERLGTLNATQRVAYNRLIGKLATFNMYATKRARALARKAVAREAVALGSLVIPGVGEGVEIALNTYNVVEAMALVGELAEMAAPIAADALSLIRILG